MPGSARKAASAWLPPPPSEEPVVVERVSTELADIAKVESDAKMEGKSMTMILTPK